MKEYILSNQKLIIIVLAVLFLFSLGISLTKHMPESKNYKRYTEALEKFNIGSYSEAYHIFGKVSRFSKLKPAAIYRQATCANKLEDKKAEEAKYKELIKKYPHSKITLRARYLKAQLYYNSDKKKKALKEFKQVIHKAPDTEYAIASNYYIALIETQNLEKIKNERKKEKLKRNAISAYKTYLKEAPTGKFALNAVDKWVGLGTNLNCEDNLLIAKIYQENGQYDKSEKFLKLTNQDISWPYIVKNAYKLKNYQKAKLFTEMGVKGLAQNNIAINEDFDKEEQNKAIYDAIDIYLKISDNKRLAISYLLSISNKQAGYDYLIYKNCNNLPSETQIACYNTLIYKYPNGKFSADALANVFYDKIKTQNYDEAKRLGKTHLTKFKNVKSSTKVIFWLAKINERTRNYDAARNYYKKLMHEYPDDYYTLHAYLNMNKYRYVNIVNLTPKPVVFPYKDENNDIIQELTKVKDYGLINVLYGDDQFIKSWLLYMQGDFSGSARIARDAMDNLETKPNKNDLRWRLVYPLHYIDIINASCEKYGNDPTLIMAIIREESYFNPEAKSAVGARGLMQLMPATAQETAKNAGIAFPTVELLYNPETNIKLGNLYFANLKKNLSNQDVYAVLAYNGGIGSIGRWRNNLSYYDVDDFVEQIPYGETQNYLKKVYRSYWNYLRIYEGLKL